MILRKRIGDMQEKISNRDNLLSRHGELTTVLVEYENARKKYTQDNLREGIIRNTCVPFSLVK